MDAAKHNACERAAELVEQYGGLAGTVVIELRNLTAEAHASLTERFGKHGLDHDFPWQEGTVEDEKVGITHNKHIDLGSGVLVNASWTEFRSEKLAAAQAADFERREQS